MRVLAIEPFYGGSHKAFLDGWVERSRHEWTLITYSAHHWKWRMRHASCTAASEVRNLAEHGQTWDVIFCTDMLNLAEFRGLCPRAASLPVVLYFHENQLTYPTRRASERDFHFVVSNFVSAVAADQVWFNSQFHQDEFLQALPAFWSQLPDNRPVAELAQLPNKCHVQHPGVDTAAFRPKAESPSRDERAPQLTWAARWEFDKNPEAFFAALEEPALAGREWTLSVLGQSFRETPACFERAEKRWAGRIAQWGFQANRADFISALQATDIFVSTAIHEFFGIGVVEAITAGATPLLPRRLAYPEILALDASTELQCCFFDDDQDLPQSLIRLLEHPNRRAIQKRAADLVARFDWAQRAASLDDALQLATVGGQAKPHDQFDR
jgi:glycosyltransferase involved in cell wall biosynthesis